MASFKTIQFDHFPKHFPFKEAEKKWHQFWQDNGTFKSTFNKDDPSQFLIDTPPPTVSGSLHVGHIFSYTQTDILARFQRMNGKSVFYPMGWDDNGLPTERRVQQYYHISCDPNQAYDNAFIAEAASSKERKKPAKQVSRQNFIETCSRLTSSDEEIFKDLWQRIGLSVDWEKEYATIDDESRRSAQLSFIDLFNNGHIYSKEAPTMWDVDFCTSVAQAELVDKTESSQFYNIRFKTLEGENSFIIATTRPELLAACVGITAHPDDKRYTHHFGKKAITPLFGTTVPIFPSELANPEKGTGILMVCTFGDLNDVEWWKSENLELRQVLNEQGRFKEIIFGDEGWESVRPEIANELNAELAGKTIFSGRKQIIEILENQPGFDGDDESALESISPPVEHAVKYYEKGKKPIEFLTSRQWFVKLLDKKDALIKRGQEIEWYPSYMQKRYANWCENLLFDWCVSRQRFFGVPFPLWYPINSRGEIDYHNPILANPTKLPIDPTIDTPEDYNENQRNMPNGFTAEKDVFDTWFTSSLTPQIAIGGLDKNLNTFVPMDLRPQSHEIIRTWAFYTIVKAHLHHDSIPWKKVAISGWVLDPDRKKMSKSDGNVITPESYIDKYSADGVRYWTAKSQLGTDTTLDDATMKAGLKLQTKLYNAAKYILSLTGEVSEITHPLDKGYLLALRRTIEKATYEFQEIRYTSALNYIEENFWHLFADSYIELTKLRAKGSDAHSASAVNTLRLSLSIFIRLLAPFLPYICEEIWSWIFSGETDTSSVHLAAWPYSECEEWDYKDDFQKAFLSASACLSAIHKQKSNDTKALNQQVEYITFECPTNHCLDGDSFQDICNAGCIEEFSMDESPNSDFWAVKKIQYTG